ncbi:hypothetical protein [uncultured Hymenobacter sp.]|uniref:hypothetical protein n=1 Tax=uncultured Hymenobacter sp. TaxID=170016 RepID=UPI0035CB01DD
MHGLLLSGFLIVLRYDNGSANFRPCGGWRPYLQARLTQVYPLFAGLLRENSWFRRLLSSRAMQALGRSSYALYLLPAGPLSFWVYERLPDYLPLRLLAVQLVSYLAYRFVEEPLTQWLRPRPG